ncbi:unnamed protein product [Chrysoparadoxa australica]
MTRALPPQILPSTAECKAAPSSNQQHPRSLPHKVPRCTPPLNELQLGSGRPVPGYLEHQRLEMAALKLRGAGLEVAVVGAGIPYGLGEGMLYDMFAHAWRSIGQVPRPCVSSGSNKVAIVHLSDLCDLVNHLCTCSHLERAFLLAVDGDQYQHTLAELCNAVSLAFGGQGSEAMPEADLLDLFLANPKMQQLQYELPLSMVGSTMHSNKSNQGNAHCDKGFVAACPDLAQEFLQVHGLEPIRVIVVGPPGYDRSKLVVQLAGELHLPVVDLRRASDAVLTACDIPIPEPKEEEATQAGKGKKDMKKGGKAAAPPKAIINPNDPVEKIAFNKLLAAFGGQQGLEDQYGAMDSTMLLALLPAATTSMVLRYSLSNPLCSRMGYVMDFTGNWEVISGALTKTLSDAQEEIKAEEQHFCLDRNTAPTHIIYFQATKEWLLESCGVDNEALHNTIESFWQDEGMVALEDEKGQSGVGEEASHQAGALLPQTVITLAKEVGVATSCVEVLGKQEEDYEQLKAAVFNRPVTPGFARIEGMVESRTGTPPEDQDAQRSQSESIEERTASIGGECPIAVDTMTETDTADIIWKLSETDFGDLERASTKYTQFLADNVLVELSKGLLKMAHHHPEAPVPFLGRYLVEAGRAAAREAEREALARYAEGMALLDNL